MIEPPGDFGLLRRRLRLSLLAIGILPLVLAGVVLYLLAPRPLPLSALVSLVAIGLILMPVALWLSRRLLGPAEALDRTRVEMRRLYESAKQDALKDALTGLGNHRAFQEELDRQVDAYHDLRSPARPAAHRPRRSQARQRGRTAMAQATRCCASSAG